MTKVSQFVFRKFDGTKIVDVNKYVKDWVTVHPYGNVTIGCDSQTHSRWVKYAISIVMHNVDENGIGHGAHVIYSTVVDKNKSTKKDVYSKLWAETEYTMLAAELLKDCGKKVVVHLDYNSKESEYSNMLYASGIGYVKGLGYEAFGKPHAWCATHTADALCRTAPKK